MPIKGLQAASIPLLHLKATANIFRITLLTDMALPTLMTKPRLQAACKRGFHTCNQKNLFVFFVTQLWQSRALAQRQQACIRIQTQFGAGINDVQIAHGQLADAVSWAEH